MKNFLVHYYFSQAQIQTHFKFQDLSKTHPIVGRLGFIPVVLFEAGTDFLKYPLAAIEEAALSVINLLGWTFSQRCSLKDAIVSLKYAILDTLNIPLSIIRIILTLKSPAPLEQFCKYAIDDLDKHNSVKILFAN